VESRTERIVFETPTHRVVGDVSMPAEGYRSRLSDYLNRGDLSFIALVNAEISERRDGGGQTVRREFIAIARDQVQLAYPAGSG
jgi:hypothetical protein